MIVVSGMAVEETATLPATENGKACSIQTRCPAKQRTRLVRW
jgi:hypothetical protein